MKKGLLLITAILACVCIKAQDTIVFRNGDELIVKVIEVKETSIKYNVWNNLDGPLYTKRISEIATIKYRSGYVDAFRYEDKGILKYSSGKMYLNGEKINEQEIKELLSPADFAIYEKACNKRHIGVVMFSLMGVSYAVGTLIFVVGRNASPKVMSYALGGSFLSLGTTFLPIGITLYAVGSVRLNRLAENYNQRNLSDNFSVSVAPSCLTIANPSGAGVSAFGAGVTINF